jgi:hypothetical protein
MLVNLRALFGVIVDIVLLRRGPENLPASNTLLAAVVAIFIALNVLAIQVFIVSQVSTAPRAWPLMIIVAALLQLVWFRAAFGIVRKPERFVQTMIAVFATSTLFIPALALFSVLIPYSKKGAAEAPPLLSFLFIAVEVWMLMILSRIVRVAFEWPWLAAIVFVFAANFATAVILAVLFGDSPQPV